MQVQLLVRNVTSNIHVRSSSSSSKLIHSCVSVGVWATARTLQRARGRSSHSPSHGEAWISGHEPRCFIRGWAVPARSPGPGTARWVAGLRLSPMATTTENLQATNPTVSLTPEAYKIVRDAIDQEPEPASLGLWLEGRGAARLGLWRGVRGAQGGSFIYALSSQAVSDADGGDARHTQEGLDIV